jgi:ABC-type sugar transport system permease subunit
MSAPAVIVFLVLFIVPMVFSFVLSLTNWTGYSLNFDFIGFENYLHAFTNTRTINAAVFTVILAVVGTILCNVFGLGLAALVSAPRALNTVVRTIVFYPSVISALIIGFLWSALLAPQGAVNGLLGQVGLGSLPFLTDPAFAKATVIFTVVWSHIGFNMILFIAGLKSIPAEYYEAATVDGAARWARFRHITLPLLAPIVTVNLVLTLVGLLRVYDIVLALTDGGPAASTETIVYQILRDSFMNAKLGFGAAQSFMLLIVTAIFGIAVTLARRGAEKNVSE